MTMVSNTTARRGLPWRVIGWGGIAVLLSVPPEQLAGFHEFAGELAEAIAPEAVLDWCHAQRQAAA